MTSILRRQLMVLMGAGMLTGALMQSGGARAQDGAAPKNVNPLAFLFERARENARRSACQSNLKQISIGILQYTQDYDERMPPTREWIDVLQPYLKSEQLFTCPSLPAGKKYGFALNSKAAGKELKAFDQPSLTVAVYETQILKRSAFGLGEYRANRHLGGANFAFVDGHVKWFDKAVHPSFALNPEAKALSAITDKP